MKNSPAALLVLGAAAALSLALAACAEPVDEPAFHWEDAKDDDLPETVVHVPPPPFSEGVFPCTDCHDPDIPVNATRREMKTAHTEIHLKHDEKHRWCLDCHDAANRDVLHLASGDPVPFEESYRLCGQCHGDKYRDWRAGVHGRRTGNWDGDKTYLLCVNCHNAHDPKFKPIPPMPAPIAPRRTP